jgi:hypothetical protein
VPSAAARRTVQIESVERDKKQHENICGPGNNFFDPQDQFSTTMPMAPKSLTTELSAQAGRWSLNSFNQRACHDAGWPKRFKAEALAKLAEVSRHNEVKQLRLSTGVSNKG